MMLVITTNDYNCYLVLAVSHSCPRKVTPSTSNIITNNRHWLLLLLLSVIAGYYRDNQYHYITNIINQYH